MQTQEQEAFARATCLCKILLQEAVARAICTCKMLLQEEEAHARCNCKSIMLVQDTLTRTLHNIVRGTSTMLCNIRGESVLHEHNIVGRGQNTRNVIMKDDIIGQKMKLENEISSKLKNNIRPEDYFGGR